MLYIDILITVRPTSISYQCIGKQELFIFLNSVLFGNAICGQFVSRNPHKRCIVVKTVFN